MIGGYIFKMIEGCIDDCVDMSGESEIWVYKNAKIPHLVFGF